MTLRDELLQLEEGFWQSAGDPDFYVEHMIEWGRAVLPMPDGIMDKKALLESVASSEKWSEFSIASPSVIELAKGCRALIYLARGNRVGRSEYAANITSVYVHTPRGWKLALHQQSPTAE